MKPDDDPFSAAADPYPATTLSRRAMLVLPIAGVVLGACAAPLRLPCSPSQQDDHCTMRHCRHFRAAT